MIRRTNVVSRRVALVAASLALTACVSHGLQNDMVIRAADADQDVIIHGGAVVTLDDKGTVAQAVRVLNGVIEAVGSSEEVMRLRTPATKLFDLDGGALLPGFVEPHLHLDVMLSMAGFTNLNPCLPKRYEERKSCPMTIFEALAMLKENPKPAGTTWVIGNGIDPSLMTLDGTKPSSSFHEGPARYIADKVSAVKPVMILDKSGHLAYVNLQAFVAAGICKTVENCTPATAKKTLPSGPGKWVVGPDGTFSGLLLEPQAYDAFTFAMAGDSDLIKKLLSPRELASGAEAAIREFARAGVTTMVNGGTGLNGRVASLAALSLRAPWVLRIRTLVPLEAAPFHKPSPWNETGLFGISGVKVWVDGSTQGCTAALIEPYSKAGQCSEAERGRLNDETGGALIAQLRPVWKARWPIQIHVNGDRAISTALDAIEALQTETPNDKPIVLIHFTVGGNPATGEDMVRKVADLRDGRWWNNKQVPGVELSVSHLIGHVAYWGGALQNILDGVSGPGQKDENGRAARLDATQLELGLKVPFSFHSDSPVSPVRPLWYVEQAVTRNTWFYPTLTDAGVQLMPGQQGITIEQALRAVTIEPARQNGIDQHVGSIEKGKVADLVILDRNPLKQPPNEIHLIRVLSTFVGGHRTDWSTK